MYKIDQTECPNRNSKQPDTTIHFIEEYTFGIEAFMFKFC